MKDFVNIIIIGICFILLLCVISSFCATIAYNNRKQNEVSLAMNEPIVCPKCPTCVNEGSVYQV